MADPLEMVFAFTEPAPELGAEAGDELIFRPEDPNFPITLRRHLTADAARYFTTLPLKFLYAEPYAEAQDVRRALLRFAARQQGWLALAP